jgi:hypothetical protein
MAYYRDTPALFGTGWRGFGTTWSYGGGEHSPDRDLDALKLRDDDERRSYRGRGPKGYRRPDDRIREDICVRLTDHPEIDASEIEIHVANGEVRLTGTVEDRQTKRLAERVAEDVPGVVDVHNQLRLSSLTPAAHNSPVR